MIELNNFTCKYRIAYISTNKKCIGLEKTIKYSFSQNYIFRNESVTRKQLNSINKIIILKYLVSDKTLSCSKKGGVSIW